MNAAVTQGRPLLDRAYDELSRSDEVERGMDHLLEGLQALRRFAPSQAWEEFCRTVCVAHPVRFLVHQDPLTERAFFKPRGYPGDPVLLDFFYGGWAVESYLDRVTDLGRKIYRYTTHTRMARALRRRREILAGTIDSVSESRSDCHVLTLECGHLREAELSQALQARRVDRFVALDRDPESLRVVREEYGPLGVETAVSSVDEILEGAERLGRFDLVYAAGLYDYLHRGLAGRMTGTLFRVLRPGGALLVTNMMHGMREAGYMEAFMDWRLNYRDAQEMFALASELPEAEVASRRTFTEESGGIVFLVVNRR